MEYTSSASSENPQASPSLSRQERLMQKGRASRDEEIRQALSSLMSRSDYISAFSPFVEAFAEGISPDAIGKRVEKPLVALLCLQAPLELFHAAGLHPHKIYSGSHTSSRISAPHLPTLMCPMLRSVLGVLQLDASLEKAGGVGDAAYSAWVIPTTCDYVVQFPEMMKNCGYQAVRPMHYLELPHLKEGAKGTKRWLEEIHELKMFLEKIGNGRITRAQLRRSIQVFHEAWQVFTSLMEARNQGKIATVWLLLMTNAFFLDTPEKWTEQVKTVLRELPDAVLPGIRVMLAGSPLVFPNFKILHLVEQAGMYIATDALCSSERLFPGGIFYTDTSEFGMMQALAQKYHQGCLCPTFAQNERQFTNILTAGQNAAVQGVIYHVLKGCHPFDLASFSLERHLMGNGLKYLKLETDYTSEDANNLLTRLEAYRSTMSG